MSVKPVAWTPGPWHVNGMYRVYAENDWLIADITPPHPSDRGKDRLEAVECCTANARLIASAPELAEALQRMMDLVRAEIRVAQEDGLGYDLLPEELLESAKLLARITPK